MVAKAAMTAAIASGDLFMTSSSGWASVSLKPSCQNGPLALFR
jgi:hypothetical protein